MATEESFLMMKMEERMVNWRIEQIQGTVERAVSESDEGNLRLQAMHLELDALETKASKIKEEITQLKSQS